MFSNLIHSCMTFGKKTFLVAQYMLIEYYYYAFLQFKLILFREAPTR